MKKVLKWVGIVLGSIIGLLVLLIIFLFVASSHALHKSYTVPASAGFYVKSDSLTLARGKHLVNSVAMCAECHGDNLGGKIVFDDPVFGTMWAPNITTGSGGVGKYYHEKEFDLAVRHGVAHDGRGLLIMPTYHYYYLGDDDIAAIYAYIKTVPPVNDERPAFKPGPIARLLLAKGDVVPGVTKINHEARRPQPPKEAANAEYGQYLTRISCIGCHSPNLAGGPVYDGDPKWPPAANLTRGGIAGQYTEAEFVQTLRTGKRPQTGAALSEAMPWKRVGSMTDDELHAIWLYLQSIPAAPPASASWAMTRVP